MNDERVVVETAVGLSAFRVLKNGASRQYSAVEFDRGWAGVERSIRTFRKLGFITPPVEGDYAVLDVLDANGDIVQDFSIRDAQAFRYIKRRLGLVVEAEESLASVAGKDT